MSRLSSLKRLALKLDLFGQGFNFKVHHDQEKRKTFTGFVFSVLMVSLVIGYGAYKWHIMNGYHDSSIFITLQTNHFDDNFIISSE